MRQVSLTGVLAKLRVRRENVVLRAVEDYLTATSIFFIRQNTGALPDRSGRLVYFGAIGMADILALPWFDGERPYAKYHGIVPTWIETKSTKGVQSSDQIMFEDLVIGYGHMYLLVREVSELVEFMKDSSPRRQVKWKYNESQVLPRSVPSLSTSAFCPE